MEFGLVFSLGLELQSYDLACRVFGFVNLAKV
jgi:hypothetical protein